MGYPCLATYSGWCLKSITNYTLTQNNFMLRLQHFTGGAIDNVSMLTYLLELLKSKQVDIWVTLCLLPHQCCELVSVIALIDDVLT